MERGIETNRAGVAEWQTRLTQNQLWETKWGFESLHRHHSTSSKGKPLGLFLPLPLAPTPFRYTGYTPSIAFADDTFEL